MYIISKLLSFMSMCVCVCVCVSSRLCDMKNKVLDFLKIVEADKQQIQLPSPVNTVAYC